MRVLMVSDVYKPVINGVSYSMDIVATGLRRLGHDVVILVPRVPNAGKNENEKEVIRLTSLPALLYPEQRLMLPFPIREMKRILRADWDVIHIQTLFSAGFLGLWLAAKKKSPTVFTYHTLFEEYVHYVPFPKSAMKSLSAFWSRRFCNACDAIISPSDQIRDVLIEYGVAKPVFVLPTPIDGQAFDTPGAQSPFAGMWGNDPVKICLYAGRLGREKNLDFLMRSFKKICDEEPAARLAVIGDGPYRKNLEELAGKIGLSEKVRFTGFVPRQNLGTWYAHADLFLFASTTETQGMVLAEALLFGLPAVIVDGPGTRDAIRNGENGFIAPELDDSFVKQALKLLRDDDLRGKFSSSAREHSGKLSSERILSSLLEVYSSVAKRK